jgi:uncharacterized protein
VTGRDSEPARTGIVARLPGWLQWVALVALSAALGAALEASSFPAAFLIGPMVAAIIFGVAGATVRVPHAFFVVAQSVVACLVAASLSPQFLPAFVDNWAVLAGCVVVTVAASSFLGWLISRWKILPGTTAVWGSAPGAASAMVLMAGEFGADQRLVAFMQYYRVILVTATAAAVARLWVGETAGTEIVWFPAIAPDALAATVLVVVAGPWVGQLLRLPSPQFIGTMVLAFALKAGLGISYQLPEWLLAASYAIIGWSIGLKFSRATLSQIWRSLPQVTASIVALIAICGGIAFLLARFAGVDPLTAYLATSPGGMDAVAIIAAAADNVDITFVMAMQMLRFLIVLLLGPAIARLVAKSVKP